MARFLLIPSLCLVVVCVLGFPLSSRAQWQSVIDGCLGAAVVTVPAAGDITIDNTAGGVTVLAANPRRCAATIVNTGTIPMRCAPTTATVTASVGTPIIANGGVLNLGLEGRQAWKCIRNGGTNTTAAVTEAVIP